MKKLILLILLTINIYAIDTSMVVGKWHTTATIQNQNSTTVEKEYLNLRANHTFTITLLVSVQAKDAYIKDLRIEASGGYKVQDNLIIAVVKRVNVPSALDVKNISQNSLNAIADKFKARFDGEPILVTKVTNITATQMSTVSENGANRVYIRGI